MKKSCYRIDKHDDKYDRTVSVISNEVGYESPENQNQNEKFLNCDKKAAIAEPLSSPSVHSYRISSTVFQLHHETNLLGCDQIFQHFILIHLIVLFLGHVCLPLSDLIIYKLPDLAGNFLSLASAMRINFPYEPRRTCNEGNFYHI